MAAKNELAYLALFAFDGNICISIGLSAFMRVDCGKRIRYSFSVFEYL